jgi:hypothetical protein
MKPEQDPYGRQRKKKHLPWGLKKSLVGKNRRMAFCTRCAKVVHVGSHPQVHLGGGAKQ